MTQWKILRYTFAKFRSNLTNFLDDKRITSHLKRSSLLVWNSLMNLSSRSQHKSPIEIENSSIPSLASLKKTHSINEYCSINYIEMRTLFVIEENNKKVKRIKSIRVAMYTQNSFELHRTGKKNIPTIKEKATFS